tara:strand:+ start:1231 stop:1488 length:258 start_codon:yes stop_codon:yes gene_type:complete
MSTFTQYTGTFVKRDGTRRTMNFVKVSDLPSTMTEGKSTTNRYTNSNGEIEVVYDTDNNGFRTFNHGTVVGTVTTKSVNLSFDNS